MTHQFLLLRSPPAKRRSVEQGRIFVDMGAQRIRRIARPGENHRGNLMLRALFVALLFVAAPATAKSGFDALLAADRAFAAASAKLDPVAGITAMLDDETEMPLPGKGILVGKAAVAEAF